MASSSGVNQIYIFYTYIYAPLQTFTILFLIIRRSPRGSSTQETTSSVLIFLLVTWYAPMLQTIGYMYDCFFYPERNNEYYSSLTRALAVCEPSTTRLIVHIHAGLFSFFVGLGFPIFIAVKILGLKDEGKLTASSSFSSLFQYYTSGIAHSESYQMIREAALIVAVIIPSVIGHSAASLYVNLLFVPLVMCTTPLIRFSSTTFKGYNLYLLSDLSGATVTLLGNLLALIGAISDNQGAISVLGATFAILNVTFALLFFFAYHHDVRLAGNDRKLLLESQSSVESGRRRASRSRASMAERLRGAVRDAGEEWDLIMVELQRTNVDKRPRVASEMNMP